MNTFDYIIKKYNLHIGRQYVVNIPNMGREDLASLFAELGFDLGTEIGVEWGYYSETLCRANPKLHLYSIDPWKASAYESGVHGVETKQQKYDDQYKEAKKRLAPYKCDILRKDSLSGANYFPDESLDFVYIDANHDFPHVANDIHTWSKKVRIGGIVAGHDYAFFPSRKYNHVKYVVQTYTRAYAIIPYFVVGADAVGEPGVIRDSIRSWFFVKQ